MLQINYPKVVDFNLVHPCTCNSNSAKCSLICQEGRGKLCESTEFTNNTVVADVGPVEISCW